MIPITDKRNFNIDLDTYFEQLVTDLTKPEKESPTMINEINNDTIDINDDDTQLEFDFDATAQQDDAALAGDAVVDAANWYLTHYGKDELLNYISENV